MSRVTESQFRRHTTDEPEDRFAKTFLSKARMQSLFPCVGAWEGNRLLGAIAWSVTKRRPYTANLQLLHTFYEHRYRGIGTRLCKYFLTTVYQQGAEYFRVSSEPKAVEFYRKLGIKFAGRQKSGNLLAIGKIEGPTFLQCKFSPLNPVVRKAVNRKGKGGCVEVFTKPK